MKKLFTILVLFALHFAAVAGNGNLLQSPPPYNNELKDSVPENIAREDSLIEESYQNQEDSSKGLKFSILTR